MSNLKPNVVVLNVKDQPITVFAPRVGQDEHLGIFESANKTLYSLLSASHSMGKDASGEWHSQWGQFVVFGDLCKKLAELINRSPKGSVSMYVTGRLEMVTNTTATGQYQNVKWLPLGFEVNGVFYTTKDHKLVELPSRYRAPAATEKSEEVELLNNMLRNREVVENTTKSPARGSRKVKSEEFATL